jgi:hypothetical protein
MEDRPGWPEWLSGTISSVPMNQMVLQSLTGVGQPALFVFVTSALGFWLFKEHPRVRAVLIGLIAAGGIAWAYASATGGIIFPPRETTHWIPYIAGVAGIAGCIRLWFWRHFWAAIVSLGTSLTFFGSQLTANTGVLLWILGMTLVLTGTTTLFQLIEDRCSGAELSIGLALAAAFSGFALFLSGSAVLGQISGAIGLLLAGVGILAFITNATVGLVIPFLYIFVLGSLLLSGCLFAGLPWISGVLLWIAPWSLLFGQRIERPRLFSRLGALLIRVIGVAVLLGLALASVYLLAQPSTEY